MMPLTPRQTAVNTIVILLVLLCAWLLIQIRSVLLLLVIGILFAAAIEPLVTMLRRRGFKRAQGIAAIYAGIILVLIVALLLIVPSIVRQSTSLVDDVPLLFQNGREQAAQVDNVAVRDGLIRAINEAEEIYNDTRAGENTRVGGDVLVGLLTSVGGVLVSTVTVFVVAFYWLTEKSLIKQLVLRRVPVQHRSRSFVVWEEIERRIGGWTRGQLMLCLIIGVISTIGYLIMGLDYWIALGLWAGVTELIPFIGPILGGAAAFIVALTDSWEKALIVVVFVLILQQVESSVLVPRVMRNAVGMSPLTVILAVLIGSTLGGPLGAILAIPIGASVQVIASEIIQERRRITRTQPESVPAPKSG
jgi:predicted PurR-regulated permease PerM